MHIKKRYIAYSHRPGFRRFGRAWSKEPITVGEVEALPEGGSREHDDVELLATTREIGKLIELNREEAYPLRIAEGATDQVARASEAARRELEQIRAAIAEARRDREAAEQEAEAARSEAEGLSAQLAELRDAVEAAEAEAREKEAEVGELKAELDSLKAKPKKGKAASKESSAPASV